MGGLRVKARGADRCAATMHQAARQVEHPERAAREASTILVGRIRSTAPREKGVLANSFQADPHGGTAIAASELVYAPVINGGWPAHNISPNPFTQRALDQADAQIVELYLDDVDDALAGVKGV